MSDFDPREQSGQQDMRDSEFRPRALAEMASAIRSDGGKDGGLADTADLIALGGGLEALDAVIASLDQGQPFDPRPGQEARQMAHVMAALNEDLAQAEAEAEAEAAEQAETAEAPTGLVSELAT